MSEPAASLSGGLREASNASSNAYPMRTIGTLLGELQLALGDETPRQAQEIVAALLDVPRYWPAMHADDVVDDVLVVRSQETVRRLRQGAPFAYAVGRAPFRHLVLEVDERVLIPRPETELIIDEVFRLVGRGAGVAVDVGTGSGAIALALAQEGSFARVIASDISLDALAVARRNTERLASSLRAPVEFVHGSLLAPVGPKLASLGVERATVIVSNPPYIAFSELATLPASVRDWEPAMALVCADDGLAATASLIRDAAPMLEPNGALVLEVDTRRASLVAELLLKDVRYREVAVRLDLTGRERFVVAQRM